MIHQGLFFNCFSSGREEPLGWEPTALHHSRNSVGHTELHPKMGGAAPRHSPGARWELAPVSTSKRSCSKNVISDHMLALPQGQLCRVPGATGDLQPKVGYGVRAGWAAAAGEKLGPLCRSSTAAASTAQQRCAELSSRAGCAGSHHRDGDKQ